jgi:hypothetical protein
LEEYLLQISFKSTLITLGLILIVFSFGSQLAAAQTFQHPGVLVSKAQLDLIKAKVNAHVEPFYTEYQWALASTWGSKTYQIQGPYAGGINQCGSSSNPDNGCKAANDDASAAYIQALLWYITGDHAYAQNAINIMNAYSHNLKGFAGWTPGIPCPGASTTCSNGPLQAAWDTEKWPRAAEIIRYSNAGWADADIQAFSDMLANIYEPLIYDGSGSNGNWELSMIEGMMGIAVFNDDTALFQHAQDFWRQRIPAYFYYYPIDGNQPAPFPRNTGSTTWNGQTIFDARVNGISQETCRDFKHTEYGIAATMAAAETAHIQGATLFEEEQPRLIAALEFSSKYEYARSVPSYVCGGTASFASGLTYVIGYNEYHNRLGKSLPNTATWITNKVMTNSSPTDYSGGPHLAVFEPLTHYADAGIPPLAVRSGDYDGDGKSDLDWHNNSTGETLVWRMDGLNVTGSMLGMAIADSNWRPMANVDLNGDGKADMLWHNSSTGANYAWITNNSLWFDGYGLEPVADTNWQIVGTGDFDGDHKTDLLWRNSQTGDNTIWFMNGGALSSANGIQGVPGQDWQVVAVADFNGDGKADILWRNSTSGVLYIWFMDASSLVSAGSPGAVLDLNWQIAAVADFDGDHKAEILWRNPNTGANYMWLLNSDGNFASGAGVQGVADPNWQIAAVADLNGDGMADLVWRNTSTGDNYVWFMNGPTLVNSGPLPVVADQNWKLF